MIFTVLLVPPFLLCAVLALGRYEERIFADPGEPEPAPVLGTLHALPESAPGDLPPAPPYPANTPHAA
ncbi:hypothetical protein ACFWUQ_23085 [Streptomyces sp. NPDC058662]|uniref:hypothetical protein n=1 Tax=Streptomyces sp. NPDC058662 TaxID=3346583 RepID=UPI003649ADAB